MPESQKSEELPTEIPDRFHDQRSQAPGALHNLSNSLDLKGYEVFRVDTGKKFVDRSISANYHKSIQVRALDITLCLRHGPA
jgi:hypothetical protein